MQGLPVEECWDTFTGVCSRAGGVSSIVAVFAHIPRSAIQSLLFLVRSDSELHIVTCRSEKINRSSYPLTVPQFSRQATESGTFLLHTWYLQLLLQVLLSIIPQACPASFVVRCAADEENVSQQHDEISNSSSLWYMCVRYAKSLYVMSSSPLLWLSISCYVCAYTAVLGV